MCLALGFVLCAELREGQEEDPAKKLETKLAHAPAQLSSNDRSGGTWDAPGPRFLSQLPFYNSWGNRLRTPLRLRLTGISTCQLGPAAVGSERILCRSAMEAGGSAAGPQEAAPVPRGQGEGVSSMLASDSPH